MQVIKSGSCGEIRKEKHFAGFQLVVLACGGGEEISKHGQLAREWLETNFFFTNLLNEQCAYWFVCTNYLEKRSRDLDEFFFIIRNNQRKMPVILNYEFSNKYLNWTWWEIVWFHKFWFRSIEVEGTHWCWRAEFILGERFFNPFSNIFYVYESLYLIYIATYRKKSIFHCDASRYHPNVNIAI